LKAGYAGAIILKRILRVLLITVQRLQTIPAVSARGAPRCRINYHQDQSVLDTLTFPITYIR
jgi:hypothetical protein